MDLVNEMIEFIVIVILIIIAVLGIDSLQGGTAMDEIKDFIKKQWRRKCSRH